MPAMEDAPSLLERLGQDRKKYIAPIRTVLPREVQKGNVVYPGFAGRFFLQGIPAALEVSVFADVEERIRDEMDREGVSAEKARETIVKDDEERRRWALNLYGMDPTDPSLYDMMLCIGSLTVDEAAGGIAEAARRPSFMMTPDAKQRLNDRVPAPQVHPLLLEEFPRIQVTARNGEASVRIHTGSSIHPLIAEKQKIVEKVEAIAVELGGADRVRVTFEHPI